MSELLSIKRCLELQNTVSRSQDPALRLGFVKRQSTSSIVISPLPGLGVDLFSYLEVERI